MKKFSEKDIRKLELLSTVTALLVAVLCVIYLLDTAENSSLLQILLILGSVFHLIAALADFMRKSYCKMVISLGVLLVWAAAFFYML